MGECLFDGGIDLVDLGNPRAVNPTQFCHLPEIGIHQMGLPDFPLGGSLLFGDLSELVVVQQDMGDVHVVLGQCGQLHGVLTKATVAADADDLATIANGSPRSHRCG